MNNPESPINKKKENNNKFTNNGRKYKQWDETLGQTPSLKEILNKDKNSILGDKKKKNKPFKSSKKADPIKIPPKVSNIPNDDIEINNKETDFDKKFEKVKTRYTYWDTWLDYLDKLRKIFKNICIYFLSKLDNNYINAIYKFLYKTDNNMLDKNSKINSIVEYFLNYLILKIKNFNPVSLTFGFFAWIVFYLWHSISNYSIEFSKNVWGNNKHFQKLITIRKFVINQISRQIPLNLIWNYVFNLNNFRPNYYIINRNIIYGYRFNNNNYRTNWRINSRFFSFFRFFFW